MMILYCLYNTMQTKPSFLLQKVGGPGLAQMDIPETGPQFSPDALVVPMVS